MEQKPASLMKTSLTYGIYLGIATILVSVVLYVMGFTFERWAQYSTLPVTIIGIILAQLGYRKQLGDEMTYGQALGVGLMTAIFASVLTAIYTYLLYTVIDTSLHEQLIIFTEQKIVEQGKVPEEQLDMVMNITKKFLHPAALTAQVVFYGAIGGLIIGLLTSIFTKKNPSDEVPE